MELLLPDCRLTASSMRAGVKTHPAPVALIFYLLICSLSCLFTVAAAAGINKDFLYFTFAISMKAEILLRPRTNQSVPLRESPDWISEPLFLFQELSRRWESGLMLRCSQPKDGARGVLVISICYTTVFTPLKSLECTLEN